MTERERERDLAARGQALLAAEILPVVETLLAAVVEVRHAVAAEEFRAAEAAAETRVEQILRAETHRTATACPRVPRA